MQRLILFGLSEKDIDVLTRIHDLDPRPEVLVVHPDPGALVLRLARLAELSVETRSPEPRPGDVVVAPFVDHPELLPLLEPWKGVASRLVLPAAVGPRLMEARAEPPRRRLPEKRMDPVKPKQSERPAPRIEAPPAALPRETKGGTVLSKELETKTARNEDTTESTGAHAEAGAPANSLSHAPPVEIWESPEATFRYLVARALGPETEVTLWWDGACSTWVPWLWTGAAPQGKPEEGLDLGAHWGTFRLVGVGLDPHVPKVPLMRVAEDLALRDLMAWQEMAPSLARHGSPTLDLHAGALKDWAAPVLAKLETRAATLWRGGAEGWTLLLAQGEGVRLDGTLVLSESLLNGTFEGSGSMWRRWDPVEGLRAYLVPAGDERHWPLRLARVARALAGEVGRK